MHILTTLYFPNTNLNFDIIVIFVIFNAQMLFHTEYLYSYDLSPYKISYASLVVYSESPQNSRILNTLHIFTGAYIHIPDLWHILFSLLHMIYKLCFCIMLIKIPVCNEETASCFHSFQHCDLHAS
jgi:hypothetical protein